MQEAPEILVGSSLSASDGTSISYFTIGHGPGLIILHGAISFALTHVDLANALSSAYTVYLPSRRGRGLSGPYPESVMKLNPLSASPSSSGLGASGLANSRRRRNYSPEFASSVLRTDVSDLSDLIQHTNASYIVGVSGGAVLALQACELAASPLNNFPALTKIRKVVLFDPPLFFNTSPNTGPCSIDLHLISRVEAEIAADKVSDALVTAMKIVQLGPLWLRIMPRFIIRMLTEYIMTAQAKEVQARKEAGEQDQGATTMADLAPVLRYDFAVCEAMVGEKERFAKVFEGGKRQVLLLGGSESPGYIREALKVLEEVMEGSGAQRVDINDAGHEVLMNRDRGGKLAKPLKIIKDFLS
jgi:pimeloyl-ACP methyl ester carboxylesterase